MKKFKSRELHAGVVYIDCDCYHRNGLQHDCPRTSCTGKWIIWKEENRRSKENDPSMFSTLVLISQVLRAKWNRGPNATWVRTLWTSGTNITNIWTRCRRSRFAARRRNGRRFSRRKGRNWKRSSGRKRVETRRTRMLKPSAYARCLPRRNKRKKK